MGRNSHQSKDAAVERPRGRQHDSAPDTTVAESVREQNARLSRLEQLIERNLSRRSRSRSRSPLRPRSRPRSRSRFRSTSRPRSRASSRSYTPPLSTPNTITDRLDRLERMLEKVSRRRSRSRSRTSSHARAGDELMIPVYDPEEDDPTIERWINRVDVLAARYRWNDDTIMRLIVTRLKGHARRVV